MSKPNRFHAFQVEFEIARNNQMQINSNKQAGDPIGLCNTASCGGRTGGTLLECVNPDSNAATMSGDYLQIEGAFSLDTVAGGATLGGWWEKKG